MSLLAVYLRNTLDQAHKTSQWFCKRIMSTGFKYKTLKICKRLVLQSFLRALMMLVKEAMQASEHYEDQQITSNQNLFRPTTKNFAYGGGGGVENHCTLTWILLNWNMDVTSGWEVIMMRTCFCSVDAGKPAKADQKK